MTKFFSWLISYWTLVLPLILGFVAVVTLLPHAGRRRIPVQAGLAAGVIALMLTGLLLIRSSNNLSMDFFFYVFAAVSVASAGAVIVQNNPVYSALYFAITVLGVCGLFLVKSASFLAAATIIVYAGAIIVTFLFVIMLAQQTGLADYDRRSRERIFSCIAGFVLLGALLFIIEKNFSPRADPSAVIAALKEAQSLTAPDRYLRSGAEILEVLQINGKPVETHMQQMIDGLHAWSQAATMKAASAKAWAELKPLLQDNNIPQAYKKISLLMMLATRMQEGHNQYSGVLSTSTLKPDQQLLLSQKQGGKNHDHVNELGRSLFGDYLYAVELAGTLLLVATIAAILIAHQPQRKAVTA